MMLIGKNRRESADPRRLQKAEKPDPAALVDPVECPEAEEGRGQHTRPGEHPGDGRQPCSGDRG